MTVRANDRGGITISGHLAAADAEDLLRLLLENRSAVVDWRECTSAHSAVVQVLLAARPELLGPPAGTFLKEHIEPLLA